MRFADLARTARRIAGPFREFGLLAGALYVADRALRGLSAGGLALFFYDLMVQPVRPDPLLPRGMSKNLRFAEIGPGHPDIALMPAREDIKRERFLKGACCLGVYRKEKLIGTIWLCRDRYEEDEVRCTYELIDAQRSVFDFDLYVFPEQRMGLGFPAVWDWANAYLTERGIRYTFSRLTRFNVASRKAHDRLASRCIGHALFLKAWRIELMLATIFPFVGLTWRPERRVSLRLRPDVVAGADTDIDPGLRRYRGAGAPGP